MNKEDYYKPIFAKIGERPIEIPEGKRQPLDLDEIPFKEIIELCEEVLSYAWIEDKKKDINPLIEKAKKILEILE